MSKVYINGSSGKMGQAILDIFKKNNFNEVDKIQDCDVVVDFSHPDSLNKIIDECLLKKKPLVIGTTGLSSEDFEVINKASRLSLIHI